MNVAGWVGDHRRSLVFLFLALAVAGAAVAFRMPVSLFPQVSFPRVVVSAESGDRPAQQMLFQTTIPMEEAIRRVPACAACAPPRAAGSAEISVELRLGYGHGAGMLQAESEIARSADAARRHRLDVAHGPDGFSRSSPTASPPLGIRWRSCTTCRPISCGRCCPRSGCRQGRGSGRSRRRVPR